MLIRWVAKPCAGWGGLSGLPLDPAVGIACGSKARGAPMVGGGCYWLPFSLALPEAPVTSLCSDMGWEAWCGAATAAWVPSRSPCVPGCATLG